METDRRRVFELLRMGRITVAEAERLLLAWQANRESGWISGGMYWGCAGGTGEAERGGAGGGACGAWASGTFIEDLMKNIPQGLKPGSMW